MRKSMLALTLALAVIAQPAVSTEPVEGPVAALEHAWLTAVRQHDRAALQRILADDFIDINVHGQVRDKATAVASRAAPAGTTQTLRDLHVRRYGDSAVATGINVVHSQAQGWTVEVAFTDVFVRRHSHWQAVSAQETLRSPAHHARSAEPSP